MNLVYEIKKYFNVTNQHDEWIQVCCPYHNDTTPSAGINCNKQWFNCFTCGGKNFNQIYNECINVENKNISLEGLEPTRKDYSNTDLTLSNNKPSTDLNFMTELTNMITNATGKSYRILKEDITDEEIKQYLIDTIKKKNISAATLSKFKVEPILDKTENLFGYIKFPINGNGDYLARKFLPDDVIMGERYLNPKGDKPYFGEFKDEYPDYILVEGIFDYLSLVEAGYNNVICNLGTAMNKQRAYPFRNKVVFILFDNDYSGYEGAQKAYTTLRQVQANPIIIDLPKAFGKDINEAIATQKVDALKWLDSQVKIFDADDSNYILDFDKQESLYTLKTGIKTIDNWYGGGLKVGLHAIAAEPGVGKTALSLFLSHNMVVLNPNVKGLYCTYEVPKSQCWSRLASMYDNAHTWTEIETNPTILSPAAKAIMTRFSEKIRVVSMWDINEIVRASKNYDFIVIDYIQRMPGDTADEKSNTKRNTKELSRLMMEQGKIIILISSIARVAYGKEDLSVFKECGDIEYCIQSGMLLKAIGKSIDGTDQMMNAIILKNTRGHSGGNFWMNADYTHNLFKEIEPDLG